MITLHASAAYGLGGKQFIARIVGRDRKFTFAREFVGRKCGKRGESATVDLDEPGLYETRDVDRKGNVDDSYYILYRDEGTLRLSVTDKEDAMRLAAIDAHDREIACVEQVATELRELIAQADGKDPEATSPTPNGRPFGSACGEDVREGMTRSEVRAVRQALLDRLVGVQPTPTSIPVDCAALRAEAITLRARLAEIERALGEGPPQ